MEFDFSQEQYMFQATVRGLLSQHRTMAHLRAGAADAVLWQVLAETGIFALIVPEDAGGMGLGFTDLALVFEEFGRALVPAPVTAAIIGAALVARHGTAAQRAAVLPGLAEGRLRVTLAFAETTGSVPDALSLTAMQDGDGWVVRGDKILVPDAGGADLLIVALRFADGGSGLALIEPGRAGIDLQEQQTLDLAGRWHALRFDNVRISAGDILGGAPDPQAVLALFDIGAAASAIVMTGMAARMLDEAVDYVGQRRQFDKVIGSFQAIKHRCADMAVAVDACRSAAYFAAWALDEASPAERARAVSMAKSWCGDNARFVCNQSIQLHGGVGFTWDLGLHLFLRRVKCEEAAFGDAHWHRERVLAETLRSIAAE